MNNVEKKYNTLSAIHADYENGNKKDAVERINEYGAEVFFTDYKSWLDYEVLSWSTRYAHFTSIVMSYHHINSRA